MPYFVPISPGSGEQGNYNRHPVLFFWTARPITWVWAFSTGFTPPNGAWPPVRLLVDGQPATDFVTPTTNRYTFVFDVPDGHHIASAEGVGAVEVLQKAFHLNTSGSPLAVQNPWTATTRFERTNNAYGNGSVQLPDADLQPPKLFPLKPRIAEHYSTILPKDKLWARVTQANNSGLTRRVVLTPTGDKVIEADQRYFYDDATAQGNANIGLVPPSITMKDGPRGVGVLGFIYKFLMSPADNGAYFMDTNGRFGFISTEGEVRTFLGWRVKPGEIKAHASILSVNYMYAGQHRDFYASKWEHLGDWSLVPEPKRFHGPWGIASLPTGIPGDGYHEFWIPDTISNRILYANHYTAHSEGYRQPLWPPAGYIAPQAPLGQTQVVPFLLTPDGQPNEFLNHPWDAHASGGKLYWTNYEGNSICRANLDGSSPEVVIKCSKNPTNVQLGFVRQFDQGRMSSELRSQFLIDGPVGVATCVRPQAIAFDSLGRIVWVERYTYAIRRLDLSTMMVETVALIPLNGTGFGEYDIGMAVDVEGTCGPKDDIFTSSWHNSDYRFGADGTSRGRWAWTSGADLKNGPLNLVDAPGYAWAIGVGKGRVIFQGGAGGWQMIEITKRQPTDPAMDAGRAKRGRVAYNFNPGGSPMFLTHGPGLEGELGFPRYEELGAMDEAALSAYVTSRGIPAESVADVAYMIQIKAVDFDYSAPAPVDCVLSEWGPWEPTSEWSDCVNGQRSRSERRTRSVVTQPSGGGAQCGALEETRTVSEACTPMEQVVLTAEVLLLADGTYSVRKKV